LKKQKKWMGVALAAMITASSFFAAGCGGGQTQQQAGAVSVKAMMALQQDTPLSSEYAGQVRGRDEVKIMPRVSGTIMEKYVTGGQFVKEGQPLYKIDSRQYESAVLSARANLAQSEATLNNALIDLRRDEALLASAAISEQTVTTQQAQVNQYQALVDANRALLKKAQEDLDDTMVYAPMDGRVDVNDVAVGTYAVAGQTTLMTLGSVNPVYVQFSISETEYLKFMDLHSLNKGNMTDATVSITLSNGQLYPIQGKLVQADRALSENTGTLTVKAMFENPRGILLPGMFARVRLGGEVVPNAILVPQRAVQQILEKTFVIVVGPDNKSDTRAVELGEKVGSYYIIKSGITAGDKVVVEGLTKLQAGMDLNVTDVTPEQMGFTLNAAPTEKSAS
jgi:membrane fusion protein (multidrug efflux system)